jgi:hypothetical protein
MPKLQTHRLYRPLPLTALALICAALTALALGHSAAASAKSSTEPSAKAAATRTPTAHAASTYLTGIGDESAEMFTDPNWLQLKTKIARYIAPYDAVAHSFSLDKAKVWIKAAEAAHEQVLVAFYHSEYTPTKMPSVATYQKDVQKFIKDFPHVKQYQSWDEANRGNIKGVLASPSASAAARYYQALIRVCKGCTVLGLDILDADNISPTLQYIAEFKKEIGKLRTVMPKIWGLHNYSDINRLESWRTRDLISALGGLAEQLKGSSEPATGERNPTRGQLWRPPSAPSPPSSLDWRDVRKSGDGGNRTHVRDRV